MIAFLRELMQPEWMFLRYALLVGALASLSLGVIGTMVVTRRISSLAGASAHAALGGVGVALFLQRVCMWTGFTPMLGAVVKVSGVIPEENFVKDMRQSFAHKFATKPQMIEGNMRALVKAMQEVLIG